MAETTAAEPGVPPAHAFRATLRVHFSDCDAQGIVFNANYLRFCDNTVEQQFEASPQLDADGFWDFVVKRAEVEWTSPARAGEMLDMAAWVSRWGQTSFTMSLVGSVGERPVFTTQLVYVMIDQATHRPIPVPDALKAALGG